MNKFFIGEVNCLEEYALCQRFNVRGYPTLLVWDSTVTSHCVWRCPSLKDKKLYEYEGNRSAKDMESFIKDAYLNVKSKDFPAQPKWVERSQLRLMHAGSMRTQQGRKKMETWKTKKRSQCLLQSSSPWSFSSSPASSLASFLLGRTVYWRHRNQRTVINSFVLVVSESVLVALVGHETAVTSHLLWVSAWWVYNEANISDMIRFTRWRTHLLMLTEHPTFT